jgi:hypothetical protein
MSMPPKYLNPLQNSTIVVPSRRAFCEALNDPNSLYPLLRPLNLVGSSSVPVKHSQFLTEDGWKATRDGKGAAENKGFTVYEGDSLGEHGRFNSHHYLVFSFLII